MEKNKVVMAVECHGLKEMEIAIDNIIKKLKEANSLVDELAKKIKL